MDVVFVFWYYGDVVGVGMFDDYVGWFEEVFYVF